MKQRLAWSVHRDFYRVIAAPGTVHIEESASDGRAAVTIDTGVACVEWKIEGKSVFGFLRDTKNADGAFFVLRDGDDVEAHIVECKRTVTPQVWSKAKLQMRWTLLRLRALAGVLGLTITGVRCYTAYRDDEIEPDSSTRPTGGRRMPDDDPAPETGEDIQARRRIFDWHGEYAHLRDFDSPVPRTKLPLELVGDVGVGSFSIPPL